MKKILVSALPLFLCFAFVSTSLTSYAQQNPKTPYQKKVEEIRLKYLSRLLVGKEVSQLNWEERVALESTNNEATLVYLMLGYAMQNPKGAEKMAASYESEMKAAAKLKIKADFEREKLEADKAAKEKRKEEISGTDYGKIISELRDSYSKWSKKGEFEKQEEWNARLMQESEKVFTKLCNMIVPIEGHIYNCNYDGTDVTGYGYWTELGKYNADGEFFNFTFNNLNLKLSVPLTQAENFKIKMKENEFYHDDLDLVFFSHCFWVSHAPSNFQLVNYRILPREIVFYDLEHTDITKSSRYVGGSDTLLAENREYKYVNFSCLCGVRNLTVDEMGVKMMDRYENSILFSWQMLPYIEEDSMKYLNPWNRSSQVIPCCVRENINPKYEIEDVIIYFDDLGLDNPFMNGSSYNYTKQQFTPNPALAKLKKEEEARREKNREEQEKQRRNDSIFDAVTIQLEKAVTNYHSLLKRTPYDFEKNKLSLSIPTNLYGENQRLSDTLQLLLDSVQLRKIQLQNRYTTDSLEFSKCNETLQAQISAINAKLLAYPYNLQKRTISDSLSFSLFGKSEELTRELKTKESTLPQKQKQVEDAVYQELKANNPKRFVEIYYVQNPTEKQPADSTYIECRCQYASRNAFDIAWVDKNISLCDCREQKYQEIKDLYHSRKEFDQSYNQEESVFESEVKDRKKMWQEIKNLDLYLTSKKQINLKKALTSSKPEITEIINFVKQHQNSYYYTEAVEVIFKYNEKLMKEWNKNGSFFKSKTEMYEYWIGEDYDKVLKARKKE